MNEVQQDLANAFDAVEEVEENVDAVQPEEYTSADQEAPAEIDQDSGEPEGFETPDENAGDIPGGEEETLAIEEPDPKPDGQPDSLDAAPKSLGAAAREAWKDAPEAIKSEFARMDKRMEGLAQKYGADAQRAQQMDKSLAPFQQLFAMNGGARETISPLLQTASILQMGTGQQKAQMVANIINQFGVDIKSLDSMLVGEATTPDPQENVQKVVQQALQQRDQQYAEQQNQQRQVAINQEVQTFANNPENEFYFDVQETMADLMDLAAKRGQNLTLEKAYEQACRLDNQVSSIIQGRKSQETVNRKRGPASSIQGSPSGSSSTPPDDLRSALEGAFQNSGRL